MFHVYTLSMYIRYYNINLDIHTSKDTLFFITLSKQIFMDDKTQSNVNCDKK